MRLAALFTLVLALPACGSSPRPAVRPLGHAPGSRETTPPPAWIETDAGVYWLGYSSYCWSVPKGSGTVGLCADFVAPACGGRGVPDIPVHRGELVRAHLGFVPTEASLSYEPGSGVALPAKRVLKWYMARQGVFSLGLRVSGGDANYIGCGVIP